MGRSAAFRERLDELGIWFPEGDGDALRAAATGWAETAEFLEDLGAVLERAAANVTDNYRGEAAERFFELWDRWRGADGYLAVTVRACHQLAATLDDFGGDVDRADETLLGLIEQALGHPDRTAADDWLRDAAKQVAGGLDRQVEVRRGALAEIAALPAELAPIDPTQVDWVGPGDPRDLSYLAIESVDFGAGPGTLAAAADGIELPEVELDPLDPLDAVAERGAMEELPPVELPEEWSGGGGGGGGGSGGFGGGGGFDLPSYEVPDTEVPEFDPTPSVPLIAGAGAAGAGVAAVAATKAGRSGPMMPFMPMGAGGVGGDDGKEPTRRRRRVVVVPPVA